MRLKVVLLAAVILCIVPMVALPAHADSIIFNGLKVGTVSYGGGAAPLVGAGIGITTVTGNGTPMNAATFPVVGGFLNFTTGALTTYGGGVYNFSPGGSITITGAGPGGSGPLLLSGTFLGAKVDTSFNFIKFFLGSGPDVKNLKLVAFFGLPANTTFEFGGTINLFPFAGGGGAAFTATADTSQVTNIVTGVPEPGMLSLMGAGLLGLAFVLRRGRRTVNS